MDFFLYTSTPLLEQGHLQNHTYTSKEAAFWTPMQIDGTVFIYRSLKPLPTWPCKNSQCIWMWAYKPTPILSWSWFKTVPPDVSRSSLYRTFKVAYFRSRHPVSNSHIIVDPFLSPANEKNTCQDILGTCTENSLDYGGRIRWLSVALRFIATLAFNRDSRTFLGTMGYLDWWES